jgi:sulfur carrier protein ThiS
VTAESDDVMSALSHTVSEVRLTGTKTVRRLLEDLGLLHRHFVVLVDGKRAQLDDEIAEGQRVLVLPIIAGG